MSKEKPTLRETWPTVDKFANHMRLKMEENKDKGSDGTWQGDSIEELLSRLKEEVGELEAVIEKRSRLPMQFKNSQPLFDEMTDAIVSEAADVGNFAMMVADKAKALK